MISLLQFRRLVSPGADLKWIQGVTFPGIVTKTSSKQLVARTSIVSGKLTGKVVEINDAGDLITDISVADLAQAPRDNGLKIQVDEHETFGLYPAEHQQPSMTLVAIAGDEGPVKITLVDDSATAMLGVQVGAVVSIAW